MGIYSYGYCVVGLLYILIGKVRLSPTAGEKGEGVRDFTFGLLLGSAIWILMWFLASSNKNQTIARLSAERDSLKTGFYFRAKIKNESDGSQWVWFQSKNDSDRWFGVNLDSMKSHGGWPPDTLKTRLK